MLKTVVAEVLSEVVAVCEKVAEEVGVELAKEAEQAIAKCEAKVPEAPKGGSLSPGPNS